MPDIQSTALQALFYELLVQFPNLKDSLPNWWAGLDNADAACQWATALAAQGQSRLKHLSQQRQRVSIFTRIFHPQTPAARRYVALAPLSTDKLLPQEATADPAVAYQQLQTSLTTALVASQTLPREAYLIRAADILRRYTWCLPSPYDPHADEPALSLYDHSRIVAALAPCYQPDSDNKTNIATLISGDISGIQAFIYTITARGAINGLRGRSFYLQLLTDAVASYVLQEWHLPTTSLIYAGGGHFYILVPGDRSQQIGDLQERITRKLWRHHRDLYVGLGHTVLDAADLAADRFPQVWQRVGKSVSQAKSRRFSELGTTMYDNLFQPDAHGRGGDKTTECRVCHYEGRDPEAEFEVDQDRLDDEFDPIRKCLMCVSLEELGSDLRHAHYVLKQQITPQTAVTRTDWQAALAEFGLEYSLYSDKQIASIPFSASRAELWALSDTALEAVAGTNGRLPIRLHYLVNETPIVKTADRDLFQQDPNISDEDKQFKLGDVKSFSLIQYQAQGIKRLGVLRMDVDDLGSIFQRGFGSHSGLVQTAALSSAISLYFEAWVGRLMRAVDRDGRDVLYAIYSGGDDLFIVGAWDLLPELAHRIAGDLQIYAAGNPRIHASAGITLHGGKFPLYQAASTAEAALEAAKGHEVNGRRKNAFTFLDRTFAWLDYDDIAADQAKLIELVDRKEIGRSLLQHMLHLDNMYQTHVAAQIKAGATDPTIYWGRGHWLHAYQMSRLAERLRKDGGDNLRGEILDLRDKLRHDNFKNIQVVGLSARWAELATRQGKENESDE